MRRQAQTAVLRRLKQGSRRRPVGLQVTRSETSKHGVVSAPRQWQLNDEYGTARASFKHDHHHHRRSQLPETDVNACFQAAPRARSSRGCSPQLAWYARGFEQRSTQELNQGSTCSDSGDTLTYRAQASECHWCSRRDRAGTNLRQARVSSGRKKRST